MSPSPVAAATPSQVESSVPLLPETPAATPTPTSYADILKEGIANMKKIEVPSDAKGIVICATTFHAFAKVAEQAEQQKDPGLTKLAAAYKAELSRTQVVIFTPAEVAKLLANADEDFLPWIALIAFGGIRNEELKKGLIWEAINFNRGYLLVTAAIAKTNRKRKIDLPENLLEWLAPYRNRSGAIFDKDFRKPLRHACEGAKVKYKRNALRVAAKLGINEDTLSHWKKLGAPVHDAESMRQWMRKHGRKTKRYIARTRKPIPLYQIAASAGISYGTLLRLRKQGAPITITELRKWLDERKASQITRRQSAQEMGVSVDSLRRWERKGAPILDVSSCKLWRNAEGSRRRVRHSEAVARRCIDRRLRARLRRLLIQPPNDSARLWELVGCSREQLRVHLERHFCGHMSWENRHRWHIDHIRPCASFDLTDPDQVRQCFHFLNLRPIWAEDNMIKGKRWQS